MIDVMDCNGAISAVNRVIISIVLKKQFPYPGEVAKNIFQKALPSGQLVMAALVSVNRCNKSVPPLLNPSSSGCN